VFANEIAKNRLHAINGLYSQGPPRMRFNWGKIGDIQLVRGKTLGLVGLGEIGTEVAVAARSVGMKIVYYDIKKASTDQEDMMDAQYVPSLNQLVRIADFISIHVPYGPNTEKLFDLEVLSNMKPSSFLINTSRGGIIDEQALLKVVKDNKISGVALDVYRWEPVPSDCPLLEVNNVLWTTHNAGGSIEFIIRDCAELLANIARAARGDKPKFLVEMP
jgi:lactate dehydrogenase-like 2-hydroxyacid dehydrogenase